MKTREISPNVLDFVSKKRQWISTPVIGTIIHHWRQLQIILLNRLHRRHNIVKMAALRASDWSDSDTRLFEASFQILVEYVESELAWMQLITEGKARWYHRWFRIKDARELALRYLNWETQLGDDSPGQSEASTEIRDLYLWYRDIRPTRVDPFDNVGDRDSYTKMVPTDDGMYTLEMSDEYRDDLTTAARLEEEYEEEDTAQLVRLMKVRRNMWT